MRVVLTDVEGTTSSISMVRDVLVPYARRSMAAFVRARGQEPLVRSWLDAASVAAGGVMGDEDLILELERWSDSDRKDTSLKALQGLIWEAGYVRGDFAAHVYPDATAKLRLWATRGHELYVYSSGSVAAQMLFFVRTTMGDLSPLFSGHFDTEIGGKREVRSYRHIAEAIGRRPADILFLSDSVEELDAARDTGVSTILLDRPADYPHGRSGAASNGHRRVESFEDIDPDADGDRR